MEKESENGKGKLVLPGDFLATEEEFAPGTNAFWCQGNVCSSSIGRIEIDSRAKEISVKPYIELRPIKLGSIVFGRVTLVKENSVSIELSDCPIQGERQVIFQSSTMLPVRNVSRDYVENLRECFKVGDIVKARVSRIFPGNNIDLETNLPDLGVVKASCSRCRKPLHIFGTALKCISCGGTEKRKIATGYLLK